MRYQGKISQWDDGKGYGFILPNGGGKRVFLHIKSFSRGQRIGRKAAGQNRLMPGDLVTYMLGQDAQGPPFASEVKLVGSLVGEHNMGSGLALSAPVLLAFGLLLFYAQFGGWVSALMVKYYLAASVLTFVVYALDKSAARRDGWRTAENNLHLLAVAGGWPGALLAQQLLRHKSSKTTFRRVFWLTVCINMVVLAWLVMTPGQQT